VGCPDLTMWHLAHQVWVIASSSCSVMTVRSGDDMKDIPATTYSLPPSDLIARSTSSFCKRHAKYFLFIFCCPPAQWYDQLQRCCVVSHVVNNGHNSRMCRFPNRPPATIDGDTVHRSHASMSRSYPGFHVCPAACGLGKSIYMLTHQ
jgi:hypothetical protein